MKVGTDTLIDSDGNIDFTNFNTIGTDPRLLEGIAITDTGGNTTFSVDTSGNVTLAGAIDWTNTNSDPATVEAQTTADDAQSTALTAEEIGKNIADGSYSGTFIDNQQIIAPTISAAVINSGTINSITINSADIDISENVSIGEQLIIDAQYLSGIE
ncbi:MAG: hypothetical protein K9L56_14085 [Clostridiales bacterium]|nr:hypothetical protein [Clostridiales bacterium]